MHNEARACVGNKLEEYMDKLAEDIYRQLFKPSQEYSDCIVHNLMVALDEWYFFEVKMKPIIEDKLKKKAEEGGLSISGLKFHLLGCTDFEILCQFMKEKNDTNIFEILREKEEPHHYFKGFSELLIEKYNCQPSSISFIDREFNNLFDPILGKSENEIA